MKKALLIVITMLILSSFFGCSYGKKDYLAPPSYYAEAQVVAYRVDNGEEIKYNLKILKKDAECKLIIINNNVKFFIQFNEGKCILINNKFPDSKIQSTISSFENLYKEINLDKFNGLKTLNSNSVEINDSGYKYILQFESNNFAPQKMSIYKNNSLIKTFEYKNVELYRH